MDTHKLLQDLISAGFSQKAIEEGTGIAQSAISRLLNGTQQEVLHSKGKRLEAFHALNFKRAA